jgi:hypothetical protein
LQTDRGWKVYSRVKWRGIRDENIYKMMPRKNKKGFTLIEAMLAVVPFVLGTAGVLRPFAGGATVQADGRHRTLAAKLAGDLLEKIVSRPFSLIVCFDGYTETLGQVKDSDDKIFITPAYAKFSRKLSSVGDRRGAFFIYIKRNLGV